MSGYAHVRNGSNSEVWARIPQVRLPSIVLKNSKSRRSENLANVADWRLQPLQGSVEPVRAPAIIFAVVDVAPSPRSERDAPAVLRILSHQRKRTFSTQSPQEQTSSAEPVRSENCQRRPCRRRRCTAGQTFNPITDGSTLRAEPSVPPQGSRHLRMRTPPLLENRFCCAPRAKPRCPGE